jgi:hypothetical protein
MTLSYATIVDNTAGAAPNVLSGSGAGFAIHLTDGMASLEATLIEGPGGGPNCGGLTANITSHGNNVSTDSGCNLLDASDSPGTDPLLGPLADNGGPTMTHALMQDSPAIDRIAAGCPPPATDQRGVARPAGPACDAGSFEAPPPGDPRIWGDNNCSGAPDPVDSLLTLRFDAGLNTNTGECPDFGQVVEVADASPHPWGDVDCSGAVNPVDSLKLLRFDAGLSVTQEEGCPLIESGVLVVLLG